jgi:hypothetical protein
MRHAYGNARLRAMKSRLLTAEDGVLCRAAAGAPALGAALGLPAASSAGAIDAAGFAGLLADYVKVMAWYRSGEALWLALLARLEVENLKLGWRARARSLPASRWVKLWRPFGALERLPLDAWSESGSLREAVLRTAATPYGAIAREVFQAREKDLPGADLAFDRWAWAAVSRAARALPRSERAARDLVLARARERDLDALGRARAVHGMTPEVAVAATVELPGEAPPVAWQELASRAPTTGPLPRGLPRWLAAAGGALSSYDTLALRMRRQRYQACRRAFAGPPFLLAPAAAYLLLREEQWRAGVALAQPRDLPEADEALDRVLAASAMGS